MSGEDGDTKLQVSRDSHGSVGYRAVILLGLHQGFHGFLWFSSGYICNFLQTSEHPGCNFYFPFNMFHHSMLCCKAQQRLSGSLLLLLLQGHFISVNDAPQNRAVFINGLGEVKAQFSSHWLHDQLLHDILIYQSSGFRVGIVS